jgi:5-methylcytosine-specific restriction endonuclease McrA
MMRTPTTDRLLQCYFTDRFALVAALEPFDWVAPVRGPRSGGETRGSAEDRRRRKRWLLATFGDGSAAPCFSCGVLLGFTELTVDRIVPGLQGGRYVRSNIRPACRRCNCSLGGAMRGQAQALGGEDLPGLP